MIRFVIMDIGMLDRELVRLSSVGGFIMACDVGIYCDGGMFHLRFDINLN